MSSSDLAISVRGLSKAYTIRHQHEKHITLAEQALSKLRHPLRRPERETFWALDDVSFDVRRGEVLGVIGRNGAGKSTLLKVLSRITAPTKGEVRLYGRVGSLLEVGTGFHPELTGRENVYLNGSILGMKTKEIDAQFDAIVDFAGVEKFLDTPVKRYSSGMYVRLAFAVAAHLETEILLIDEVLAVGDAEFQKKCIGKMDEVAHAGRTVLFVSHSTASIVALCPTAILLQAGAISAQGATPHVLAAYGPRSTGRRELAGGEGKLESVEAQPSQDGGVSIHVRARPRPTEPVFLSVHVVGGLGTLVQIDTRNWCDLLYAGDDEPVSWDIQLSEPILVPGRYHLELFLCTEGGILDRSIGEVHVDLPEAPLPSGRTARFTGGGVAVPKASVVTSSDLRACRR